MKVACVKQSHVSVYKATTSEGQATSSEGQKCKCSISVLFFLCLTLGKLIPSPLLFYLLDCISRF